MRYGAAASSGAPARDAAAVQRALHGAARELRNRFGAPFDAGDWPLLDAWLTDIDLVLVVLGSV